MNSGSELACLTSHRAERPKTVLELFIPKVCLTYDQVAKKSVLTLFLLTDIVQSRKVTKSGNPGSVFFWGRGRSLDVPTSVATIDPLLEVPRREMEETLLGGGGNPAFGGRGVCCFVGFGGASQIGGASLIHVESQARSKGACQRRGLDFQNSSFPFGLPFKQPRKGTPDFG